MKERIFFISPLPEDEEEQKAYYDKYKKLTETQEQQATIQNDEEAYYDRNGKSTATTYYDEHGQLTPAAQEQPEENTRLFIIYEAPKIEVATQQYQTPEDIPTISISEEIPGADLYAQPEKNITKASYPYPYPELREYFARDPYPGLREYFARDPYPGLREYFHGKQSQTEENQLASIRSELQGITIASGAPAPHAGEIAQAA